MVTETESEFGRNHEISTGFMRFNHKMWMELAVLPTDTTPLFWLEVYL